LQHCDALRPPGEAHFKPGIDRAKRMEWKMEVINYRYGDIFLKAISLVIPGLLEDHSTIIGCVLFLYWQVSLG